MTAPTRDAFDDLLRRVEAGDERALARALSAVERGDQGGRSLLRAARRRAGRASVVGVTGAPGSGKSTLVDALIERARADGRRVAVVAVDPSSPSSGGALLGDRIRMARWYEDRSVFVRSMGARGHVGGLARATLHVVAVLDAVGFDLVLVETVGVGQGEVDVATAVDTTVVVLTPHQGDAVQAIKAGLMEVADVFVVNKADLGGAERVARDVRDADALALHAADAWRPVVVVAAAASGDGVDEVAAAVAAHRAALDRVGGVAARRRARVREEVRALALDAVRRGLGDVDDAALDAVADGSLDAAELAAAIVAAAAARWRVD